MSELELGVDVSQYELIRKHNVTGKYAFIAPDVDAMDKAKVTWLSIRCTVGYDKNPANMIDPGFKSAMEFLAGKKKRQPYHWYQPTKGTALAQANAFMQNFVMGELPPMLDLEDYRQYRAYKGIVDDILTWANFVEARTGQIPELYTSPSYIKSYFTPKDTDLRRYKLSIANYDTSAPLILQPFIPEVDWVAWQVTAKAQAQYYGVPNPVGYATISEAALYLRKVGV